MAGIDEIAKALATSGIKEAEKEALVSFSDGIQRKLNTKEEGTLFKPHKFLVLKVICLRFEIVYIIWFIYF